MKPINVKKRLPKNNTYVLARYTGGNWTDNDHQSGVVWKVVKFVKGITEAEREALPSGSSRKRSYHSEDVQGNNLVPYCWREFGPGKLFGQDVDFWMDLPKDSECA